MGNLRHSAMKARVCARACVCLALTLFFNPLCLHWFSPLAPLALIFRLFLGVLFRFWVLAFVPLSQYYLANVVRPLSFPCWDVMQH